jgi:hypothetical protein
VLFPHEPKIDNSNIHQMKGTKLIVVYTNHEQTIREC